MPSPPPNQQQLSLQLIRLFFSILGFVRDSPNLKLCACLAVDAVGFSSYLLPGLGEVFDAGWAPIQAWFLYYMFGGVRIATIGFFEELLPGTDFCPSATLGWLAENVDEPTIDILRTFVGVPLRERAKAQ